jgi:hypothetical protein
LLYRLCRALESRPYPQTVAISVQRVHHPHR